ncbi:MAG: TatD family hydrolase [Gammaproteobacteria bacterium]|jgi:TatD DNase family protein
MSEANQAPAALADIGVNLAHDSFDADRGDVIERALRAGVSLMVVTGTSVTDSRRAVELAATRPGVLYATAGVHPHHAREWTAESAAELRELQARGEVVAAGECGLDFFRDFSPRPDQERAFHAQLELAAETGLPVFLHQRAAHDRFVAILREYRDELGGAVIHCFTGSRKELYDCLDLDLHVGVTGWICDERRGLELREAVTEIPPDRLMLETDAPYLLPRDLSPRPKTRRNEPAWLPHVARTVARCRRQEFPVLAEQTTHNARHFFALDTAG